MSEGSAATIDEPTGVPFGPGSISLGLHPHAGEAAPTQANQLVREAIAAEAAGFDGVTVSEHHVGFPGYMPQPLLAANWLLAATERIWAGPNPTLLGLRNMPLLAEALAWTAARFPGRVGATFVAGYARDDFEAVGVAYDDRLQRLPGQLDLLVDSLAPAGRLAADPAVRAWQPSAALQLGVNSAPAARRAAGMRMGVVYPGGEEASRLGRLTEDYRAAGGVGVVMCIVNVWVGSNGGTHEGADALRADSVYKAAADSSMRQASGFKQQPFAGDADEVAAGVVEYLRAASATAVNIRLNALGASSSDVLDQITCVGLDVIPAIRRHFNTSSTQAR